MELVTIITLGAVIFLVYRDLRREYIAEKQHDMMIKAAQNQAQMNELNRFIAKPETQEKVKKLLIKWFKESKK